MQGLIDNINAIIDWFFSTELPEDTANVFADIAQYCSDVLMPLLREYIAVIFG